ncbi:MAG: hypothetical protein J1F16_07900 [Muribaculaceae bacterium]|nr:hypothetical protein [Muribaculaceae bacterium]
MKKSTTLFISAALAVGVGCMYAADAVTSPADGTEGASISYELDPASGSTLTEINKITVYFEAGENVGFYDGRGNNVVLENTTSGDYYYATPFFEGRNESGQMMYSLEFSELGGEQETISLPGTYTLTISGAYTTTIDDEGEESEPEDLPVITAEYTVISPVSYTLDPADGATVEEISTITLTFEAGKNVGFYEGRESTAVLEDTNTGDYYYATPFLVDRNGNGEMVYTLEFTELGGDPADPVTLSAPGVYNLTIKGAYTTVINEDTEVELEPVDLPVINATYTIAYPVEYTLDPENGAVVPEISKITLSFAAGVNVGFYEGRATAVVLENKQTGDALYSTPFFTGRNANGEMTYELEFTELGDTEVVTVTNPGEYVLTISSLYTTTIDDNGEESDKVDLPVINALYTVASESNYILNPESGSNLTEISEITITFAAGENVGFYSGRDNAVLENLETGDQYTAEPFFEGRSEMGEMTYSLKFKELGSSDELVINQPGNYLLTLRGAYTSTVDEDGEESDPVDLPVITANYTIVYPVTYFLSPADGDFVDALSKVTLTFAPGANVGFYEGRTNTVTLENTATGEYYYSTPFFEGRDEDGVMTYTLEFTEMGSTEVLEFTTPGVYNLSIKGLYMSTIDDEGEESEESDWVDLPAINAVYTIPYPVDYTLNPANGSSLTSIEKIILTFEGGKNVGFYEGRSTNVILENLETGDQYTAEPFFEERSEDGEMTYSIEFKELGSDEPLIINQPGDYSLTIRGLYTSTIDEDSGEESDKVDLPVITANYKVVYPIDYVLDPASGSSLTEIEKITITFPEGLNVGFSDGRETTVMLENQEAGTIYSAVPFFEGRSESGQMVYSFEFTENGEEVAAPITLPGNYLLTIRGLYTSTILENDEETEPEYLPVINATYTIDYPIPYILNPASGANLEEISTINLSFQAGTNVGFYDGRETNIVLENVATGDEYVGTATFNDRDDDGVMSYTIEFKEIGQEEEDALTLTQPGNYKLTVRGLYTSTIDEDGNESEPEDLPVIYANYTIVYPIEYVLTPEDGSILYSINEVTITFEAEKNVGVYDSYNTYVLENLETGDAYYATPEFVERDEFGRMTYSLKFSELGSNLPSPDDEPAAQADEDNGENDGNGDSDHDSTNTAQAITTPGKYQLSLRGFYTTTIDEDGNESDPVDLPAIIATYEIEYPVAYTLNPDSGATLDEITAITITFAPGVNVGFHEGRETNVLLVNKDNDDTYTSEPFFTERDENGGMIYWLAFMPLGDTSETTIVAQGEYELTIRGLYYSTIDEQGNESDPVDLPVITATYTVTGDNDNTGAVSSIVTDDAAVNAYSINGLQVIKEGKGADINSLPAGIYVINGKKVLIRK